MQGLTVGVPVAGGVGVGVSVGGGGVGVVGSGVGIDADAAPASATMTHAMIAMTAMGCRTMQILSPIAKRVAIGENP
jgi:hypothetical protein